MIGFFLSFILVVFGWTAFGEKSPSQTDSAPLEELQSKEIKTPDSLEKTGAEFRVSAPPRDNFKKLRETVRLEWAGGLGVSKSGAFLMPLTLEINGPALKQGREELRWLLQGGGILLGRIGPPAIIKDLGFTHILQTGLRYHFSETLHGSVKGGAIQALVADRVWTIGLFFGAAIDPFTLEAGWLVFSPDEDEIDTGIVMSLGTAIKLW